MTSGAPRKTDRGELPKVNGSGAAKAVVSNHRPTVRSLEARSGFLNRFGRKDPAGNAFVVFAAAMTVNGGPDSIVSSLLSRPRFGGSATPESYGAGVCAKYDARHSASVKSLADGARCTRQRREPASNPNPQGKKEQRAP